MKIFIKETGKIEDLTIKDSNGTEWTQDLLGNHDATHYNEETEQHEMSQEDFEWWDEYIDNNDNDEMELTELAEELNIDEQEIRDRIMNEMNCDLEDEHAVKQNIFAEIRNEKTFMENKTWGELSEEQRKQLLKHASTDNKIDSKGDSKGDCIIDFEGYVYSVTGKVVDGEIVIDNSSIFYNPIV